MFKSQMAEEVAKSPNRNRCYRSTGIIYQWRELLAVDTAEWSWGSVWPWFPSRFVVSHKCKFRLQSENYFHSSLNCLHVYLCADWAGKHGDCKGEQGSSAAMFAASAETSPATPTAAIRPRHLYAYGKLGEESGRVGVGYPLENGGKAKATETGDAALD